jgi:thiol-disulfide isomerase/thioredoxin
MKISSLTLMVFTCLAASVFSACQNRSAMPQSAVPAAPPDFTLPDANGAAITLSAYKGKVVLLDFWATWCGGCKVEIPWYMEFAKKYEPNGLAVIGVSMDQEGWSVVKPFMQAKQMTYPVVLGDDDLAKRFGLTSMPLTLLIDRGGKIALSHAGVVDKASFESKLRELLGPV